MKTYEVTYKIQEVASGKIGPDMKTYITAENDEAALHAAWNFCNNSDSELYKYHLVGVKESK